MDDKAESLKAVCEALAEDRKQDARQRLEAYKHNPFPKTKRKISDAKKVAIFDRDGFIDCYSGRRLIFPGTLHLLSHLLKDEERVLFPYHKNWKFDSCHFAFWELSATVDHVVPVARGGTENDDNLATTSQLMNAAKGHFKLEEIGWKRLNFEIDSPKRWDGMKEWFLD